MRWALSVEAELGKVSVGESNVATEVSQAGVHDRSLEEAGYIEINGAQIYTFLHGAANPVARVLLVGPFASERYSSYIPWIRWARFLASRRIEAMRFDYGGVGESTGKFEDMGFHRWGEQVAVLARWLKAQRPDLPLVLHGLELGALLAGNAFSSGLGDAMLLWSLPRNANEILRRSLWRQAFMRFSERSSFADYIRLLEADKSLEVGGYTWPGKLWRESLAFRVAPESAAGPGRDRPVKMVKLEGMGASVFTRPAMGPYVNLNPDLTPLFTQDVEWISRVLRKTAQEKA